MTVRRIRLLQIRLTSALMRPRPVSTFVGRLRRWPLARSVVNVIAGYNRVFSDLSGAREASEWYARPGHESAENARGLQEARGDVLPSDYPVLYYLSALRPEGLRVFDLGGSVGSLFYLYDRFLRFPPDVRWVVHDLPANMDRGRALARQHGEVRLGFAGHPGEADGTDVLLVSGALHYFPFDLPDYLAGMARPPAHVIVNRTPLVERPTAATVQYVHGVMIPCRLLNRAGLVAGMARLGYRTVDTWREPYRSIRLPYDPEYWVREYTGIYFRAGEQ